MNSRRRLNSHVIRRNSFSLSVVYIDVKLTQRLRAISTLDIYFARFVAAAAAIIQVWAHGARHY